MVMIKKIELINRHLQTLHKSNEKKINISQVKTVTLDKLR
jgi:hypothetical protein